MNDLKNSVEFMSTQFENLRGELAQARSELRTTQIELQELKKENVNLRQEVNDLQQYTRRDNVMVFGVPETEEPIYDIIGNISDAIGGSELMEDISIAHRLPSKPGKTRPIVIRFSKRRSREEWLRKFRNEAKKDDSGPGVSTQRFNARMPVGRITAGDQLTTTTRNLLNSTRDAAQLKGYQFVWTRDGKVFARKNENSPVSRITCAQDVNNL